MDTGGDKTYGVHKKFDSAGVVFTGLDVGGAGDSTGVSDQVDCPAYHVDHDGSCWGNVDILVVLAELHRTVWMRVIRPATIIDYKIPVLLVMRRPLLFCYRYYKTNRIYD